MTDPAARPAAWMLLSALLFSVMGALAHTLGGRCDWLTTALIRAVFMLVSAVIVARAGGATLVFWRPRTLWLRSLAGSFSLVCSFYALTRLPLADVLTLTHTYPIWIVVLTALAVREFPRGIELFGVASGLAGVVLIERPHLAGDRLAAGLALACSFTTAVAMLGLHRLRGVDARAVVAHFAGVASVVAGVWFVARGGLSTVGTTAVEPLTLLLLLGVGVTGTAGQIFLTKAYAAGAPSRVAVLGLTQVVFGLAFDVLIWQRTLPLASVAGIALVLAPAAWLLRRGVTTSGPRAETASDVTVATVVVPETV